MSKLWILVKWLHSVTVSLSIKWKSEYYVLMGSGEIIHVMELDCLVHCYCWSPSSSPGSPNATSKQSSFPSLRWEKGMDGTSQGCTLNHPDKERRWANSSHANKAASHPQRNLSSPFPLEKRQSSWLSFSTWKNTSTRVSPLPSESTVRKIARASCSTAGNTQPSRNRRRERRWGERQMGAGWS